MATYGRSTFYTHFYYLPKFAKALIPVKLPGPGSNWDWGTITGLAWGGKYWVIDDGDLYRYSINVDAKFKDTISISGAPSGVAVSLITAESPAIFKNAGDVADSLREVII